MLPQNLLSKAYVPSYKLSTLLEAFSKQYAEAFFIGQLAQSEESPLKHKLSSPKDSGIEQSTKVSSQGYHSMFGY
jgi:hypothetical protein